MSNKWVALTGLRLSLGFSLALGLVPGFGPVADLGRVPGIGLVPGKVIVFGPGSAAAASVVGANCLDAPGAASAGSDEADASARTSGSQATQVRRERALETLRDVVAQALARSQAVGAANLLAEAATIEIEEARAARLPRAALTAGVARAVSRIESREQYDGTLARGGITVSAPLYDAGRTTETVNWRRHLADAARFGQIDAREQVALQTLSLSLELDRHEHRVRVAQQQVTRMACLADSIERAVAADQGRRSELDQARKTLQEAQLALSRSATSKAQVALRLRRFTGDVLPALDGLDLVLAQTPALGEVVDASARSSALRQLAAQANAADAQARVIAAGARPRIDFSIDGNRTAGATETTAWQAGLNLVVPLYDPGLRRAAEAATRRAQAARLQLADSTEARTARLADVHEQAGALGRDTATLETILENSARVREATLAQWQRLGRRSLFDVMSAERDHFSLRLAQVDALHDRQQANALLWSLGAGIDGALSFPSTPAASKSP